MTLQEYLNQTEPKCMPNVLLEHHEVMLYRSSGGEYQCQVPAIADRFKIDASYIVGKDNLRLYVLESGKPSCFSLNFDPSNLSSESTFHQLSIF